MLRATLTTIAAVAALILVVKVVAAPGPTAAERDAMKAATQKAMSVYDLHVDYPTMRALAAQKTPQP